VYNSRPESKNESTRSDNPLLLQHHQNHTYPSICRIIRK